MLHENGEDTVVPHMFKAKNARTKTYIDDKNLMN